MPAVLVTGGMGVIGSYVTRNLIEQGHRPVAYGRHLNTILLKDLSGKFDFAEGSLDLPSLISSIRRYKVERVIHMATAGREITEGKPMEAFKINAEGTMNVLEACRLMDIKRVVYISSKAVYDVGRGEYGYPTYKPIDEDYPRTPRSVYGATKLYMENMGLAYNRIYGLDFIAVRFASTYGPAKLARWPTSAIQSMIIEAGMLKAPLKIPRGGDEVDDMIYHEDIASGVVGACFAEKPEHRIFHLGTGVGYTLGDLVKVLEKIYGKLPIEIGPGLDYFGINAQYGVFDISRAKKELGFNPKYNLEDGVKAYIQTMKNLHIEPNIKV